MITNYDLIKVCIAELGFDPNFLALYVSPLTKKRAADLLDHIKMTHGSDPSSMEFEIARAVEDVIKNNRRKRFAIPLIMLAYERKMISKKTYEMLRRKLGATGELPEEMNEKQEMSDPFSVLEGKGQVQQEIAPKQKELLLPAMQQNLPIAASLKRK